ncbi:PDZ domain-containing protein [soil metagenome]
MPENLLAVEVEYLNPMSEIRLQHRVHLVDAKAHLIEVETTVSSSRSAALPSPLVVFMAVWTPGSYLVREYARHVEGVAAGAHAVKKTRKNAWQIDHGGAPEVTVRYRVYANDLTVRTNHVDDAHLYLNGAPTFFAVEGHEDAPAEITLAVPESFRVATALPRVPGKPFTFAAKDFDTLVDSPIEVGDFREGTVTACGVPHRYAVWPPESITDDNFQKLLGATKAIVETEAALFGGSLPFPDYTFILHLSPRGRGGLEHRASTTLLAPQGSFETRDGYLDLLSLVAHEYFHLWNVKRLRPAGLFPYRYDQENYTRLLWWFEGGTSYYDWRTLRLAKLCTETEYLDHLAHEIAYLDGTPGRLVHALEEASFDAWIKLYRPDENSPNSTISYYRKGELVNALLDVEIRVRTNGARSLDHVLALLWERHGSVELPVPEDGMQKIFEDAAGVPLEDLFATGSRGTTEIDAAGTLRKIGLAVERTVKDGAALGVRTRDSGGRVTVQAVLRGGAAHGAGVEAGDEIVAIGDRRLDGSTVDGITSKLAPGTTTTVLVARDGKLKSLPITLEAPRERRTKIVPSGYATDAQKALFRAWMGGG